MKINNLLIFCYLLLSITVCSSQEAQLTIKVVDDLGKPIEGATVGIATFERTKIKAGEGNGEDVWKNTKAITDKDGVATIKGNSPQSDVAYGVDAMSGYYWTKGERYWFKSAQNGKWQPWNPAVTIILRRIIKPIPMYAKMPENLTLPELGKPIGYDLAVGDWVMP